MSDDITDTDIDPNEQILSLDDIEEIIHKEVESFVTYQQLLENQESMKYQPRPPIDPSDV